MWIKKYQNAPGPLPAPDFSIESAAERPIIPEFATEEAAAKRTENAESKRKKRDGKQIEYIAKYNLEHGTHFWNIDQVREHAAQNSATSKPIVNTGDEISILQQIRQNQADAAAKVDIESGTKDTKEARQDAQKEFVVQPAEQEAITGLSLALTAPAIATTGVVPLISGVAGGILGQITTDKATNYFSNGKYNTFGEFVRQGNDWGTFGNFASEMTNPGAWIGGRLGTSAPGIAKTLYNQNILNNGLKQAVIPVEEVAPVVETYIPRTGISEPTINYSIIRKPAKLSLAERFGIPKQERNNMSRVQREAFDDLQYLIDNQNKQFVVKNGQLTYSDQPGENAIRHILKENPTARAMDIGGEPNLFFNTQEGRFQISPSGKQKLLGYFARNFPTDWGDASATTSRNGLQQNLILTSPFADFAYDHGVDAAMQSGVSRTIPKEVMRSFWKNLDIYNRPGTFLSGDYGRSPAGLDLYTAWKNANSAVKVKDNFGNVTLQRGGPKTRLFTFAQTQPKVMNHGDGLSTDSYMAILKQGNRPGHKLRFSTDGFDTFNNQSFENRFIQDALEATKQGKMSQQEFINMFNEWVKPYGGMSPFVRNGEIIIPQPFVRYKQGGKLCHK